MKFETQNANNLISKDPKVAKAAARAVIDKADFEAFYEVCSKSEFIFDFIKEKVANNLLEAVNGANCANLLLFTPCYCADFEDFVVDGMVKFAREELTDALLEFFETGTDEQKAYCAAYFTRILDPLALDYLIEGVKSEFLPFKTNCAKALRAFGNREVYDAGFETLKGDDEFMSLAAIEFLAAYGDPEAFEPVFEFMKKTQYAPYVALDLLGFRDFETLWNEGDKESAFEIFDKILNGYPEILPLSSIVYADIRGFLGVLADEEYSSRVAKLILKTKVKFDLISSNDNYTYDLNKDTKAEIQEIERFVNLLPLKTLENALGGEFESDDEGVIDLFEIVTELNLSQYAQNIADKIGASNNAPVICEGARALRELGLLGLVDEGALVSRLNDENAIALLKSYFSSI